MLSWAFVIQLSFQLQVRIISMHTPICMNIVTIYIILIDSQSFFDMADKKKHLWNKSDA